MQLVDVSILITSTVQVKWWLTQLGTNHLLAVDTKFRQCLGQLSVASKKDPRLTKAGVSGFNKPKRTPSHPKKSHVVVAKEGSQVKLIRFGQQGVTGDRKPTPRQASFKARHRKNIARGKMSAAYWADKVKW